MIHFDATVRLKIDRHDTQMLSNMITQHMKRVRWDELIDDNSRLFYVASAKLLRKLTQRFLTQSLPSHNEAQGHSVGVTELISLQRFLKIRLIELSTQVEENENEVKFLHDIQDVTMKALM
mgnify:CR=1 FL=1